MRKYLSLIIFAALLGCGGGEDHDTREISQARRSKDATPPVISINPDYAIGMSGFFSLRGLTSDNQIVSKVTWVDSFGAIGTATLVKTGTASYTWNFNATTPEGLNTYTVTAQDGAGNKAVSSIIVRNPTPITVSWVAPTTNDDGSPLVDLAGYFLSYGTEPGVYTSVVDIRDPAALTHTLTNLPAATYYLSIAAYNVELTSSVSSLEVSKLVK